SEKTIVDVHASIATFARSSASLGCVPGRLVRWKFVQFGEGRPPCRPIFLSVKDGVVPHCSGCNRFGLLCLTCLTPTRRYADTNLLRAHRRRSRERSRKGDAVGVGETPRAGKRVVDAA